MSVLAAVGCFGMLYLGTVFYFTSIYLSGIVLLDWVIGFHPQSNSRQIQVPQAAPTEMHIQPRGRENVVSTVCGYNGSRKDHGSITSTPVLDWPLH